MADAAAITVSAPGSLMLLGEHAVLHGKRALVCAINRRITLRLQPSTGHAVKIISALGTYESPLTPLTDHSSFQFVLQAIRRHAEHIPSGFELRIDSEFSADVGFGSSAAVTAATHAALMCWITGAPAASEQVFERSMETVLAVQGRGSGSDLAASIYGGVVGYRVGGDIQPVEISVPLVAVYCGYKTPTPDVIRRVDALRAASPEKYERIFADIDRSVEAALVHLRNHDFSAVGKILNRNHQLMVGMGVNTPELQDIVTVLQNESGIFGAKISGSGLGDCAVGIGHADLTDLKYPVHHLEITPDGCLYHE